MSDEKKDKKQSEERESKSEINIDLGFGGLFQGLGNLVDMLSDMAETAGEAETTRTGEFRVKGLGEKGRGVYGVSIRTGIGGSPKVEHFGNIRQTDEGPVVAEVREPLVDVFDEAEEIVIVAELAGVGEGEIDIDIKEDILRLETTGERRYAKEILLEHAVDPDTLNRSYKNGILELRVRKSG